MDGQVQISTGALNIDEMVNARSNSQVQLTASTGNLQINAPVVSTALATGSLGSLTLYLHSPLKSIYINGQSIFFSNFLSQF